jgi:putative spermidine/putrescine transport system ATP-binding protein
MPGPGHVQLQAVTKRFGQTVAVDAVTLDVARGSLTTILGPSGCGKTTLLRLIGGFVAPDAGEVRIGGEPQRGVPPYLRRTSTVFQDYALFPHMSVADNVAYGLRLRRVARGVAAERVRQVLALVRLTGLESRLPRELSGGQQQRVALARSLVIEPEVLLMDEPLSSLDAKLRVAVRAEIREIQERLGITTIYVTHDQEEALAVSDTVAVMRQGTLAQVGTPREVYEQPADPFVAGFVGEVNLVRATVESGPDGQPVLRFDTVTVPLAAGAGAPAGREVVLALRPEAIRIASADDDREDGLPGHVVSATYLGTTARYRVELARQRLTVDDPDPAGRPLLRGAVRLTFDPGRIRLWPGTPGALADPAEPG